MGLEVDIEPGRPVRRSARFQCDVHRAGLVQSDAVYHLVATE
jgi:hypothetical protein